MMETDQIKFEETDHANAATNLGFRKIICFVRNERNVAAAQNEQ